MDLLINSVMIVCEGILNYYVDKDIYVLVLLFEMMFDLLMFKLL